MKRCHFLLAGLGAVLVLLGGTDLALAQKFLGKSAHEWAGELNDNKPSVRRGAAFALGKMGASAELQLSKLLKALNDSDPSVREAVATAIGEIGFAMAGPHLEAIKARAARPTDPNAKIDEERAAEDCARAWSVVASELTRLVNDTKDPSLRRAGVFAIGGYGRSAGSARAALEKALDDKDLGVRQNTAWALGRLGPAAGEEAVNKLCQVLTDSDTAVRRDAAGALGEIGRPTATKAIEALVKCCRSDKDANVRKAAIGSLVNLCGPEDRTAPAMLQALLDHADLEVVRGAAFAMGNVGGKEAAPAVKVLRQALQEEDPAVKQLAAASLANIGPDAAPAVPELVTALTDPDEKVRRNAAMALGRIGPGAKTAIANLAQALRPDEPDAVVRRFAAEALAYIGQTEDGDQFKEIEALLIAKALPSLLDALQNDKEANVRQRAVWALFNIQDPEKAKIVTPLTNVLNEKGADGVMVRYDAARCLARMGPQAPDKAVDILFAMLNDKNLRVYKGTDAKVSGGAEGQSGDTRTAANLGGDARFLAAQALARIGNPKANRKEIVDALNEYLNFLKDVQDKATDAGIRKGATDALTKTTKAIAAIQGK